MNILEKMGEMFLYVFPGYRKLKRAWERTNRELDGETASKNNWQRKSERLKTERDELIRRCFKAIHEIEYTRLSQSKKDKIIDILRGLE